MNISKSLKALRALGPEQVGLYALYKFGLKVGHYRRAIRPPEPVRCTLTAPIEVPSRQAVLDILGNDGQRALLNEADEIVGGRVRLFGSEPTALQLASNVTRAHWTHYETGKLLHDGDIKLTWEPARFGWATVLARAYHISGNEKYAEAFWNQFGTFIATNPPYRGPNWVSGQEAALRIITWTFSWSLLREAQATTLARTEALAQAIAVHAGRIPATLVYARSQNNNHLLSEAAGLVTAGMTLPDHPRAQKWIALGRKWFNRGLEKQIDSYGEYSQHSTNYHRLMLQLGLWVNTLATQHQSGRTPMLELHTPFFTHLAYKNLARASHWLASILDGKTGGVPNLGANDGAYILPLTVCSYSDFRPVVGAVTRAFLDYDLPGGVWDEMSLWFGNPPSGRTFEADHYLADNLHGRESWAYLRATRFTSRPGHADLLHFDLWWRGLNIARDAGTFSYNADPPWDNPLTAARFHNTVTVDGRDQMTRVSRFLYVDWAHAYARNEIDRDEAILGRKESYHRAYRNPNIIHRRTVTVDKEEHWVVFDRLRFEDYQFKGFTRPKAQDLHIFRIHWLLPDWKWEMVDAPFDETQAAGYDLRLLSPHGWITVRLCVDLDLAESYEEHFKVGLARAGERIWGNADVLPTDGWFSPTYEAKEPALSLSMTAASDLSAEFSTVFFFPQ